MIKKTFFLSIFALATLFIIGQPTQAEAKRHCRNSSSVQLNVGAGYRSDSYMTRRYARPVIVQTPVVYAPPTYYSPYAPVYAYPAPVYVEEVYVTPAPRPCPFFGLGGLSFSWTSFFK